ncbi:MAG: carboxypeptidase regulatory-like domain-containing protein [bacterium]|nr:carboxypeptidase regulatory-like domain-containing protein [bacterium]
MVDSETGLPLAQAFVSLSPWTTGYGGGAAVSDDVTGADGAFAVHDIPVAMIGDTGVGFQVLPLIVSRAGYHTARFVHTPPSGIDHPEVSGLVIELSPLGAADNGTLTGRVLRAGVPVAGLVVGLGSVPSAAKGAVGIAGRAALTGADGRFDFSGLPAGAYVVHPGFLVGDGAWFGGGAPAVDLAPGGAGDAGDLVVLHEIAPACGNPQFVAWPDSMVTFRWTPVPGAARYGWFLDGDLLAESAVESVTVNLSALAPGLAPGLHAWQASAVDAADQAVGVMQNDAWFRREAP